MEILSLIGGSLLSVTFELLLKKLDGYLSDRLRSSEKEVCAQMESWKTFLPKIIAILQHAEENPVANEFTKLYLNDLRNLAYDMEDLLEEFVIDDAKRSNSTAHSKASTSKGQKVKSILKNPFKSKAKLNRETISMVEHLNVRLKPIKEKMDTLGLFKLTMTVDNSHKVAAERPEEPTVLEDYVCGRDSDKKAILEKLFDNGGSPEQNFVIPIVGMGGLGKTTLARIIYNDEELEGKFDLKAWVCVSDVFDVARITRDILEYVTKKDPGFKNFALLQEELKGELCGHKFLLVLDDVWNEEYDYWDRLKRPFMSGASGSKIIVTTRNEKVGRMMRGDDEAYNLEELPVDACLPLFTWHALGKENFNAHPHLQEVGEKLVERGKRLPLALKTLGGILRGKQGRDEWEKIYNSNIWGSKDKTKILPILRLSYNDLPPYLKQCFAYCALFPKDYEFDKIKLVRLWMAEGLLQSEDIGHQYFEELLSRSLFQPSSRVELRFVMHDLINDLAVDVAREIYCNLERSMGDGKLEKAFHLSFTARHLETSERFEVLKELKHLRTFLSLRAPTDYFGSYLSNRILHDLLPTLNRLRVLSFSQYEISKLPDFVEKLKHIRYIDLSRTKIECLPDSVGFLLFLQTLLLSGCEKLTKLPTTIGNLLFLQTLSLSGCNKLTELPTMIGNLIDLHHLDITNTSLKEMPLEIGNLKNLVTLSTFIVGKASGMMRLSALKNLSKLQGRLSILGLRNVLNVQDAVEANLDKIHGLKELQLGGCLTALDDDRDESVLSKLKPHPNLKRLEISGYGGKSFPNWVCDPSLFLNLSSMELNSCSRCTLLPSLGRLPVLKKLVIKWMKAIEAVGPEFYGQHDSFRLLEELEFRYMSNWKEWTSPNGSEGEFPRLHRLVIEDCPKLLGQLPSNLCSLKELVVDRCHAMLLKSMVDLTSLTKFRIRQISELTCLPRSFIQSLTTLETLHIECCEDLTCLWEEGAEIEQNLLPFNLKHLSLYGCGALESLPDAMMMRMDESSSSNSSMLMSRLEGLNISSCPSLKSFPRGKLPISLKHLNIVSCENLESLPNVDGDNNNSNLHLEIRNVPCLYSSKDCDQPLAFLKKIEVIDCDWLESFPERMLQRCTGLQSITIVDCKILKSLPTLDCVSNLVELFIHRCKALGSLPEELGLCTPNLKVLRIGGWENFKSLPNTMNQLKSLQELLMYGFPGIEFIPDGGLPPNLTELCLECKNLKRLPNTMYQLKSLQTLAIPGGALTSLQQLTIELPSSLTKLTIVPEENLESIPGGLFQNLSSLQELWIHNCPRLQSLPKEAFPPSLGQLYIHGCPHLKRQRFEEKGDYWTFTRNIPDVTIISDKSFLYPSD
ncbi:hypothetical protein SLEP1_g55006 [Rubroshorea leprosula]|uniref:Disease resistance RPP13-like protein 1 n=1 Tax=Rubroshorea leprosula TaxID=152421 RepID=A0AAV5MGA6_9ROSI|nr:hypothetical protein SLEP1_g55006 [Rubroshorea leprosula]